MRNSLVLFATVFLWSASARAAAPTNPPPMIDIKAKSATYQFKTGAVTFSGGVTVNDPDMRMQCVTLVATFTKKKAKADVASPTGNSMRLASGDDIDRIEATGSVVITSLSTKTKGTVGRADRAIYTAADRRIVMLGNRPKITRPNGETTTADRFTYDIEAGTFTGEGNTETTFRRPKTNLFNTTTRPPR